MDIGPRDTVDVNILLLWKLEEGFGLPQNMELVRVQGHFTQDIGEEKVSERDLDHMSVQ